MLKKHGGSFIFLDERSNIMQNSAELSFECCTINYDLLRELTCPKNTESFSVTAFRPYETQAKRHKKKRINKKWAKRYGYVTKLKPFKINNLKFSKQDDDLYFSFDSY